MHEDVLPEPARGKDDAALREEGEREFRFVAAFAEEAVHGSREEALAAKRAMPAFDAEQLAPHQELPPDLGVGRALLAYEHEWLDLEVRVPDELPTSFGSVGGVVDVVGEHRTGALAIGVDPSEKVAAESLRLFRWEDEASAYRMLSPSGPTPDGRAVWGTINEPGRYVVIGLPTDPLLVRTLMVTYQLRDVLRAAAPDVRNALQHRICQLVLCAPDMAGIDAGTLAERLAGGLKEDALPEAPAGWQPEAGPASGPCELCLGLAKWPDLPPEIEIIPELVRPLWPLKPVAFGRCRDSGWISLGPGDWWEDPASANRLAGCAVDLALDPTDPDRLYAATAAGGLWRLSNAATAGAPSWAPLSDFNDALDTACVAVAASNPSRIYISQTPDYRVVRSDNGGTTWQATGSAAHGLGHARRLLVHPSDSDTVIAATSNGVWISADAGVTWHLLRAGDYLDAAMDPDDSSIVYVGEHLAGLFKTYNLGLTWHQCVAWGSVTGTGGSNMIQIAVGRQRNDANRRVAVKFGEMVVVNGRGGRPPGVAGGGAWTNRPLPGSGDGYGYWCHALAIDPFDDQMMLAGAQQLFRTTDGGGIWNLVASFYNPHEDQHSVVFDPTTRNRVYVANDGGVFRSTNGGQTWSQLNVGIVTAQFYRVGVAGDRAVGNTYHSGIIATETLTADGWGIVEGHAWEFANVQGDPRRPNYFYVLHGALGRLRIPKTPTEGFQGNYGTPSFRPRCLDVDRRSTSQTLLAGTEGPGRIMRTLQGNQLNPTWAAEPGVSLATEAITAIGYANTSSGMAYALSNAGRVFTKADADSGAAWTQVGQWAGSGDVVAVAVDRASPPRLYAARPGALARSTDGGGTWVPAMGAGPTALPASPIHSLVTYPPNGRIVFAGLEIGVFISVDEGVNWQPFDVGLPNASVQEIQWVGGWLYATTHGRGLWRRRWCS